MNSILGKPNCEYTNDCASYLKKCAHCKRNKKGKDYFIPDDLPIIEFKGVPFV